MRYLTVLFDFDGTLADTQNIALRILNGIAPEFGMRPISPDEIPALKKMSAWQLLRKRSGIPLWNILKIRRLERRIRDEFRVHSSEIQLFSGITEMMHALRASGYELGVISSNDHLIVTDVLKRSGVEVNFIHAGSKFFGKTRAIQEALNEYAVHPAHTVYVGDELRDIDASKKNGVTMIAVGWGFNDAAALRDAGVEVAETPVQLLSILTHKN